MAQTVSGRALSCRKWDPWCCQTNLVSRSNQTLMKLERLCNSSWLRSQLWHMRMWFSTKKRVQWRVVIQRCVRNQEIWEQPELLSLQSVSLTQQSNLRSTWPWCWINLASGVDFAEWSFCGPAPWKEPNQYNCQKNCCVSWLRSIRLCFTLLLKESCCHSHRWEWGDNWPVDGVRCVE